MPSTASGNAPTKMLIAGQEITPRERESYAIFDPATGLEDDRVPLATPADIDRAVQCAHGALPGWRKVAPLERGAIFDRAAKSLTTAAPGLAAVITRQQGKLLREAEGEVLGVASFLEWAAAKLRAREDSPTFMEGRLKRQRRRVPLGIVAVAAPWNFPLASAADHAIAALAEGCTVVMKTPETCPSALAIFARILIDAGIPEDALHAVSGKPRDIVPQLASHREVKKLAYTGSTAVGAEIAALAARHLKPTVMELGGNAPAIVTADADLDLAVAEIAKKKYANTGQNCVAPNRIYVHARRYDDFCEGLRERAAAVKTGDGMNPLNTMGPLASLRQARRMAGLLNGGIAAGGRVIYAGSAPDTGYFSGATVIADVGDDSPLFMEEIFGPIAAISRYEDGEELIRRANNSDAGLAGYVFAGDGGEAEAIADSLDVGMVALNTCAIGSYDLPFGGVRGSGWGYVYADEGMGEFARQKSWTWQD
jgi:succinate-semialdehyde dehydrogenase/glutarate-semialdehyde dehydrogenase